jgi:Ca-activated chloride channel family protein
VSWADLSQSLAAWPSYELAAPERAWLFWVLALLLVWGFARWFWGQALVLAAPAEGPRGAGWLRWLAPLPRLLRLLGLLLLLLALLRPQVIRNSSQSDVEALDIMLCLDISGSMETQDLAPSRVEAAKATLKTFVDNVPGDRIGLVVFAGKAFVQCPLTLDHDVIKQFIDRVALGSTIAVDGTAIGDGLLLAVSRLMQDQGNGGPPPSRLIVLATDGQNNTGTPPAEAARLVAEAGIKAYTIGMGKRGGATRMVPYMGQLVPVHEEEPDEPLLKSIAEQTGGQYFRAENADQLKGVYIQIAGMERRPVKVKHHRDADEHFYPFLLAGALLLLGEALLRLRLRVSA